MRLNPSKCAFLCISNKRSPIHHSYYLNNHLLQCSSSVKYLGVVVDSKWSWNEHVSHVSLKASRALNLLRRNIYTCNSSAKRKGIQSTCPTSFRLYKYRLECSHSEKHFCSGENPKSWDSLGVAAGTTVIVTHGQSHLVNVVMSFTGHLFLRRKYLTIVTIYDIYHCHISLPFSSSFSCTNSCTRSHSFSLQCKQLSINS